MEFNELKQCLTNSPELEGLDEELRAFLLWRGQEVTLEPGAVMYAEGAALDDTFCLSLAGELLVERGGAVVGTIPANQMFGEIAYFAPQKSRFATVRASLTGASVLRIGLTPAELGSGRLEGLKNYFGQQAWTRFVSGSQCDA